LLYYSSIDYSDNKPNNNPLHIINNYSIITNSNTYPRYTHSNIDYSDNTNDTRYSIRIIEILYSSVYENPDYSKHYSIEMKARPAAHVALFGKQ
jgi:hypothetical protein